MQRQRCAATVVMAVLLVAGSAGLIAIARSGGQGGGLGAPGTHQPLDDMPASSAPEQWRRQWADLDRQLATLPQFPGTREIIRESGGRVEPPDELLSAIRQICVIPELPRPFEEVAAFYTRELRVHGWMVADANDEFGGGLAFVKGGYRGRLVPASLASPDRHRRCRRDRADDPA